MTTKYTTVPHKPPTLSNEKTKLTWLFVNGPPGKEVDGDRSSKIFTFSHAKSQAAEHVSKLTGKFFEKKD